MTKLKFSFIFFFIGLSSIAAQAFVTDTNVRTNVSAKAVGEQNIKILAVMVEFQKDKFELTQGDGTFGTIYSKDYGNEIIDPLPHDKNYFSDHLRFAVNYFNSVSNGKVNIEYTILPDIIKVSKVMREYSSNKTEGFKPLANFSEEVWQLAVRQNPSVDFAQYNLFAIFHAGVGKDISTSQLLGEAKDLPSLFFNLKSFKKYFGENFNGFPANNSALITNTMILPETESREEKGIGGTSLLELSINGLLVSSIASYLGLPDLFNSENGKSAIGRFGLMDGQSLFAYKGLFPPEPSAWEKVYMGWEEPVTIDFPLNEVTVFAKQHTQSGAPRIVKIPINSTEYFLVENRQRDANKDGIKITYKVAGVVKSLTLPKDTLSFNNTNTDTISGVVIDVDEFDWAIPGNGILIWHIDEKIINEKISENKINADKNHRGVDLEEADGIQDIGEEFKTIFGTTVIAEGDKYDFWYKDNPSELYKNKFDATTKPNTNSNNGANSLISFSNFSSIANRMTFELKIGNQNIQTLGVKKIEFTSPVTDLKPSSAANNLGFWFLTGSTLVKADSTLSVKHSFYNFSDNNFAIAYANGRNYLFGTKGKTLKIIADSSSGKVYEELRVTMEMFATAPVVVKADGDVFKLYVALQNGKIAIYNFNTQTQIVELEKTLEMPTACKQIVVTPNNLIAVADKEIFTETKSLTMPGFIKKVIATNNREGDEILIALTDENKFYVIKNFEITDEIEAETNENISDFSLADLKQDGDNYILFYDGSRINALNLKGFCADNFPIRQSSVIRFVSAPLVADIDNDGFADIITVSSNSSVFVYSGLKGKLLKGFPLSAGGTFAGVSSIVQRSNKVLISLFTSNGSLAAWNVTTKGKVSWESRFGNNGNNAFIEGSTKRKFKTDFFPKKQTYNWPNPVYGNKTYIRSYVAEDAIIKIRIFDLSGDLVDVLEYNATGGLDNEIAWDVSNVQSGAYIAHIEINSASGKTESKIIKIAVVK